VVEKVIEKMRLQLLLYIEKALAAGVDFMAFEDPVGGLNILGPRFFERQGQLFSKPFAADALKLIDKRLVLHLGRKPPCS